MNWSMTCWSTKECPEAAVGVITVSGCNMVSVDCMLISIVSVSVKALEMLCAVAAEASVVSDVRPQEFKLVLFPTLTFNHLIQGLTRL